MIPKLNILRVKVLCFQHKYPILMNMMAVLGWNQ